ncbi:MAG: hypothetical protein ACR2KJ_00570, partial [Jatrophihabitans sp.]
FLACVSPKPTTSGATMTTSSRSWRTRAEHVVASVGTLGAGAGAAVGGLEGTLEWPVVGTFFGALEGAGIGAAAGVVCGLVLAISARWSAPVDHWPPAKIFRRALVIGVAGGGTLGAVAGVTVGLCTHPLTSPAALVEGAVLGSVSGAVLSLLVGAVLIAPRVHIRP